MPVTVNSMAAMAPARAWTRRSPNRSAGAFLPPSVTVGLVIRSMTGLTSAVPWPTVSVSSSRALIARALSCSSGRLCSCRLQRFARLVDGGLDAQRDAVLQVLLQAGILVEDVQGDQVAVPVDLRLEPAAGGRNRRPAEPLAEA